MERRKLLVVATGVFFFALIGGMWLFQAIFAPHVVSVTARENPSMGSMDAKIEIVAFEDFLCRACSYFSLEVLPALQTVYIEPGFARYVMAPVALSPHSKEAANAALSVFHRAPQSFFSFAHDLFRLCSHGKPSEGELLQLARKVEGLDIAEFAKDIELSRYNVEIERNIKSAKMAMKKKLRIPAVFVDGLLVPDVSFAAISSHMDLKVQGEK